MLISEHANERATTSRKVIALLLAAIPVQETAMSESIALDTTSAHAQHRRRRTPHSAHLTLADTLGDERRRRTRLSSTPSRFLRGRSANAAASPFLHQGGAA